jgi:hypothetical protein
LAATIPTARAMRPPGIVGAAQRCASRDGKMMNVARYPTEVTWWGEPRRYKILISTVLPQFGDVIPTCQRELPMSRSQSAIVALSLGVALSIAQPSRANLQCERPQGIITAEGAAYDIPGGARIALLAPARQYVVVSSAPHNVGERWLLLVDVTGSHVGWIRPGQVRRHHLGKCSVSIDSLYGPN